MHPRLSPAAAARGLTHLPRPQPFGEPAVCASAGASFLSSPLSFAGLEMSLFCPIYPPCLPVWEPGRWLLSLGPLKTPWSPPGPASGTNPTLKRCILPGFGLRHASAFSEEAVARSRPGVSLCVQGSSALQGAQIDPWARSCDPDLLPWQSARIAKRCFQLTLRK